MVAIKYCVSVGTLRSRGMDVSKGFLGAMLIGSLVLISACGSVRTTSSSPAAARAPATAPALDSFPGSTIQAQYTQCIMAANLSNDSSHNTKCVEDFNAAVDRQNEKASPIRQCYENADLLSRDAARQARVVCNNKYPTEDYGRALVISPTLPSVRPAMAGNQSHQSDSTSGVTQGIGVTGSASLPQTRSQPPDRQSGPKISRPAPECLKLTVSNTNSIGTSWSIINSCIVRVSSTHCFDSTKGLGGACNRLAPPGNGNPVGQWWGGPLGKGELAPGQSTTTVYVPTGMALHVRGCEMPGNSKWVNMHPTGNDGAYDCQVMY